MDKHTIFSIILLITFFALGFVSSSFTGDNVWSEGVYGFEGKDIYPIVNDQYSKAVLFEINSATSKIDVVMFSMKFYETNNSVRLLEDALINAAKRGVKVRVVLDQSNWHGSITSTTKENWKTKAYLEDNGVKVKLDDLDETTHVKLLIIDGKIVIIGSTNWTYSAFERNNEANVLIKESNSVEYFIEYFDFLWRKF